MKGFMTAMILLLACLVHAQEDTLLHSAGKLCISGGIGWSQNIILDEFISPMLYSGRGYAIQSGLEAGTNNCLNHLLLSYQHSHIRSGLYNNSAADLYLGQVNWIRAYRINAGNRAIGIFAGGNLSADLRSLEHELWDNNKISYCFALSMGPCFVINIPFLNTDENLNLMWELSLPVLSYVMRPGISSVMPEGSINRGNLEFWGYAFSGRLTGINKYQELLSRLNFDINISERFGLRLVYSWVYQQYNVNNAYKSANHLLGANITYRIGNL